MTLATVSDQGQVTIPKKVRDGLGIGPGDRIDFVEVSSGKYEVVATTKDVTALKGMFGKAKHTASIEEMNDAIAKMGQ